MNDSPFLFDPAVSSAVRAADMPAGDALLPAQPAGPLAPALLQRMHRYWMAANYLTVGQIFLCDNPLLPRAG